MIDFNKKCTIMPVHFNIKPEAVEAWNKGLEKNTDPYGRQVYLYAARWANMMDEMIELGYTLEDQADKLSHKADISGLSGFMYGLAVSLLHQSWVHGEQLRLWHNKQYRSEGQEDKGGVINPAVMTIGEKSVT